MKLLRTLGATIYTAIIALGFLWMVEFVLNLAVTKISGWWQTGITILGILVVFSWIAEYGLQILSIPYDWLWDNSTLSRFSSILPSLAGVVGAFVIPFRIETEFTAGDWVLSVEMFIISVFFFYNLVSMPFINPDMGIGNR